MSGDDVVSCTRTPSGTLQSADMPARDIHPAVDFTAGVIAGEQYAPKRTSADSVGAAGLVVGQPLDVVKVRYQTPDFAGKYTSIYKAFGECSRVTGRDTADE